MQITAFKMSLIQCLIFTLFAYLPLKAESLPELTEEQAEKIGTELYIYGYPLVTMDWTKQIMINTVNVTDNRAPVGQFFHLRKYPDASFKDVTAPNADTLYSIAWLDLSVEPYILHVPDENGRYYLMPLLDGWTDVIADPGTRTTGTKAADFAITGPGWRGQLPAGVKELKSPTNMVWVIGRTYSTGTPEDYAAVHAIQDKYSLTPLKYYGKSYTPPEGLFIPNLDMKTPVREQVNRLDAGTFFSTLSSLMVDNPPAKEDAPVLEKMSAIGLKPGFDFDISKLTPAVVRGLERAPQKGIEEILAHKDKSGEVRNGWGFSLKTGSYGTDYLQRAYVAYIGLGANLPEDAIYPITTVDNRGKTLNGANHYVIHFDKDKLPPVNGFWSLTMYDPNYFFVENALNRYSIGSEINLRLIGMVHWIYIFKKNLPAKKRMLIGFRLQRTISS